MKTFTVCTDGHSYPLDWEDPAVRAAVTRAIAKEVAAGLGAPEQSVSIDDLLTGIHDGYVTVVAAIQAPISDEAMTAFWTATGAHR